MAINLHNITIVLCNTSHPGNIGATARAMKTMGLFNLILVDPLVKPNEHTYALASNATDVVDNAKIVTTLDEAIANASLAFALTSRKREFSQRLTTPKESVNEIFSALTLEQKVAIVFGGEKNGLTITQLEQCNRLITIPGNPLYSSLNLAQAVQIIAYEIYSYYNSNLNHLKPIANLATMQDTQGLLMHLDLILNSLNFYKNKNAPRIKRRLQHIVHKATLEREEVDLLRGVLTQLTNNLNKS